MAELVDAPAQSAETAHDGVKQGAVAHGAASGVLNGVKAMVALGKGPEDVAVFLAKHPAARHEIIT